MNIFLFSVLALLVAGSLGTIMGINRTFRTRDKESALLQTLATIMGVVLIGLALYGMFTAGGIVGKARYVVPFLLVLGVALGARWLAGIHVAAVIILMLALGILYVLGLGGLPHSMSELLQGQHARKLALIAALVVAGAVFLMVAAFEKVVDLALDVLGQGLVVTALSLLGLAHAVIILLSGNPRGLLKYL